MLVITGFSACDSEFTGSGRKPERTLTFLPGDGEGDPHPEKALDGENYTLPNATTAFSMTAPEKKQFSGWKDGGEGTIYKVNDTYTVKRSATFIAQWKTAGTPDAPKVKQGASSVSDSETAITITWEEASGADSYILYCKKYESFPSTTGLTEVASGITSLSYTVERDNNKIPLEQGVDYTFYVKAVNVAGESPYSDLVTYRLKPPANRLFFDKNGDWGQICLLNVKDMGITSPVTAGTYTFAIHGTADKDIGRIAAQLVDNGGDWKTLSDYNNNMNGMKAGEPFFQVITLAVEEGAHSDPEDAVLALFIQKNDNENKNISVPSSISYTAMSLTKNEANQITFQTAYDTIDNGWVIDLKSTRLGLDEPVTAGTYTFAIRGTADKDRGRIAAQLIDNKGGGWKTLSDYNSNMHDMKAGEPFFQVITLAVEEGAHSDPKDVVLRFSLWKNEANNPSGAITISYTAMSLARNEANQITFQTAYNASDNGWFVELKASDLGWNKPIQIGQTYILAIEGSLNYGFNWMTTALAYNKDPWRALSDYNSGIAAKSRNETFKENIYITTANAPDPSYGPDGVIVQLSISNNEIQGSVNEPIRLSGAKISLMNAF
jgi:hypothetical protein